MTDSASDFRNVLKALNLVGAQQEHPELRLQAIPRYQEELRKLVAFDTQAEVDAELGRIVQGFVSLVAILIDGLSQSTGASRADVLAAYRGQTEQAIAELERE